MGASDQLDPQSASSPRRARLRFVSPTPASVTPDAVGTPRCPSRDRCRTPRPRWPPYRRAGSGSADCPGARLRARPRTVTVTASAPPSVPFRRAPTPVRAAAAEDASTRTSPSTVAPCPDPFEPTTTTPAKPRATATPTRAVARSRSSNHESATAKMLCAATRTAASAAPVRSMPTSKSAKVSAGSRGPSQADRRSARFRREQPRSRLERLRATRARTYP